MIARAGNCKGINHAALRGSSSTKPQPQEMLWEGNAVADLSATFWPLGKTPQQHFLNNNENETKMLSWVHILLSVLNCVDALSIDKQLLPIECRLSSSSQLLISLIALASNCRSNVDVKTSWSSGRLNGSCVYVSLQRTLRSTHIKLMTTYLLLSASAPADMAINSHTVPDCLHLHDLTSLLWSATNTHPPNLGFQSRLMLKCDHQMTLLSAFLFLFVLHMTKFNIIILLARNTEGICKAA